MSQLFEFINTVLRRYSAAQRVVLVLVLLGLLSVTISLVLWANRPEFVVLYTDLDAPNASRIIGELQGMKVRYEIKDSGKTILVPEENAAELRLKFVESGYVGSTIAGYEVFDNQQLGMTTFMQQLNMRRALEGELTKTINQFPGVKNSRVHLVIPEQRLFENDARASASVVIDLVQGRFIGEDHVKGIAALVSNSVEGLNAEDVVVVDTQGNLLTDGQGEESLMGSTGNQWDLRHAVEQKLESKVRNLVEGIVGPRNAVVEVSVDMNFEQVERTLEAYDPENVVVISEERHTESSTNIDTSDNVNVNHSNEDVITNYELNKTVERFVGHSGTIVKQSVAVLVNGSYREVEGPDGKMVREYVPRSSRELSQLTSLVRSAVGYTAGRGDLVEVQNVEFDTRGLQEDLAYFEKVESEALRATLINRGLVLLGLVVAFFVVRGLLRSVSNTIELPVLQGGGTVAAGALPRGGMPGGMVPGTVPGQHEYAQGLPEGEAYHSHQSTPDYEVNEDVYMAKLSPEARARLKAKDRMTEEVVTYSKESPEDTAKILRTWLTNERS